MNVPGWIAEEARSRGGSLTVATFIDLALYHPQHGYYMRRREKIGPRGDFSTGPSLSPALGSAVAAWIAGIRRGGPVDVIEIGAGNGALAGSILDALGWLRRRRTRYRIVEKSPGLAGVQAALLGRSVEWHDHVGDAIAACRTPPVIISNELIDAFPCRVLEFDGSCWMEVGVTLRENGWVEVPSVPLGRDVLHSLSTSLRHFVAHPPPAGWRIEIHERFAQWMANWLADCGKCDVLTIDYGDTVPGLHHRRPRGSLRAYFKHMLFDGAAVYDRAGSQDITADVNFSDLVHWFRVNGLEVVSLVDQRGFMEKHGGLPSGEAGAFLAMPGGAGSAFRVLHCARK